MNISTSKLRQLRASASRDFNALQDEAAVKKYGKPKPRLSKGMNKTEAAYRDYLAFRQIAGEIADYRFIGDDRKQGLNIGEKCIYIPDFLVTLLDGRQEYVEVKGFNARTGWDTQRDDAIVKFKASARQYPQFAFRMVRRERGEWVTIRLLNAA